jgi:hypothetical protein
MVAGLTGETWSVGSDLAEGRSVLGVWTSVIMWCPPARPPARSWQHSARTVGIWSRCLFGYRTAPPPPSAQRAHQTETSWYTHVPHAMLSGAVGACTKLGGPLLTRLSWFLAYGPYFEKNKTRLMRSPCFLCIPPPPHQLLNGWINLYETWHLSPSQRRTS